MEGRTGLANSVQPGGALHTRRAASPLEFRQGRDGRHRSGPDDFRISPPRIDEMHPNARASHSQENSMDGMWTSDHLFATHATAVRPTDKSFEIFLPANASAPDRDFVLRWRRAARPALLSAAWISADQEATYALA